MPRPANFLRFVVAGGIAALVNFCSRIVLSLWLSYAAAIVLAYLLGLITAFVLNRRFVFAGARNPLRSQLLWFATINILAILQTLAVSLLLAEYLLPRLGVTWHVEEIAHAFGVITPVFVSYYGHRRFSFPSH